MRPRWGTCVFSYMCFIETVLDLVGLPGKSQESVYFCRFINTPRMRTIVIQSVREFSFLVVWVVYSIFISMVASGVQSSVVRQVLLGSSGDTVCAPMLLSKLFYISYRYYLCRKCFFPQTSSQKDVRGCQAKYVKCERVGLTP